MSLKIFLDHAQRRLWKHRIGVTVAGSEWVGTSVNDRAKAYVRGSNIFIEPVTDTLMILPYCLTDEWSTAAPTGNYVRWGLSEFSLAGTWDVKSDKQPGQNRMFDSSPMAASAISATTLPANQGMWLSIFVFNEGDKEQIILECGWSNTGEGGVGVSLRFFAGGRVQVWKDGVLRDTKHLTGSGSRNSANKYVNLVLLPFRRRELLVYSPTSGGGFTFLFDEISEDEVSPVITASSKFWFQSLIAPDIEIAPLKFPTTAWAVSPEIVFGSIPETGRPVESCWDHAQPIFSGNNAIVYGDASYHGSGGSEGVTTVRFVETTSDTTTFVPNGVKRKCKLRFDLAGNGSSTPFVYGVSSGFEPVYASTPGAEVEITKYVVGNTTWTVPDSAQGVNFKLELCNLNADSAIATVGFPALDTIAPKITKIRNRPVRIELDGLTVLDGLLVNLEESGDSHDRRLHCEAHDMFAWAEKCQITSRLPLDTLPLCRPLADGISAIGYFVKYFFAGFDGTMDDRVILSDADFRIPYVPGSKASSFGTVAENGDTVSRVFEKLHKLFCESWIYGQKPHKVGVIDEPVIFFTDPVDFPSLPFKELYCDDDAAIAASVPTAKIRESLFGIPVTKGLDVEANEVRASGMNPRTDLAIQSVKIDNASQNPTTAPGSRPDNWCGFPLIVGVLDPRFTTTESCERAVLFGFDLITQANYVTEYPSFLAQNDDFVPAWRGDFNKLNDYEYDEPVLSGFVTTFDDESDTDTVDAVPIHSRYTSYTGGTLYNQGGAGLREIINNARAKAHDRTTKGAGSQKVLGSLVSVVTEV